MEILTKADGLMLILGYFAAMLGIIALLKEREHQRRVLGGRSLRFMDNDRLFNGGYMGMGTKYVHGSGKSLYARIGWSILVWRA